MSQEADEDKTSRLERERDLYLRVLNLGLQEDLGPFLEQALALMAELVGAHQAYLEVSGPGDREGSRWWVAFGFSDEEIGEVRVAISRGIIAAALGTGETIVTRSASRDQRFEARESVREGRIEAVVCAPIGGNPPIGVVYLQRRVEPGAFSEEDRLRVELLARHLAPYADRLLRKELESTASDPTLPLRSKLNLGQVIGRSEALAALLQEVALVAPLDVDVLLTGESGTGKSQIARVIHENGPRARRSFIELNCAAIPETLIESELFGALPGSHSTASRRIEGKVAAADGGTLLLDEVGELPAASQAKLLQLLQERIYYPLGAPRPVRADVRIIAATNQDLEAAVKDRRFRQDLYYRLRVMPIRLPALAERREDIRELARYFCASVCERHRLPRVQPSLQLLDALEAAAWPGNVRQLGHTIEAAAIRAAGAGLAQIEPGHLFPALGSTGGSPDGPVDGGLESLTFQEATRRFQAKLLRETLEANGWNVVEAARKLDIARSHVYALIRGFGIVRTER